MVDNASFLFSNQSENNLISSWQKFEFENNFCDVTLYCDGNNIKAHKFVLSSSSLLFKNVLKNNLNQHQIIYISGVEHKYLQNVIKFMYQGEVNVPEEDLDKFLHLAEDLQVLGLSGENRDIDIHVDYCDVDPSSNRKYNTENPTNFISESLDAEKDSFLSQSNFSLEDKEDTKSGKNYLFSKFDIESKKPVKITTKCVEQKSKSDISDKYYSKAQKVSPTIERNFNCESITGLGDIKSENTGVDLEENISVKEHMQSTCEICGKQFNQIYMRRHKLSAHNNVKYPCDQCDTSPYTDVSSLSRHKKAVHKGVRHQCEECGLSYTDKSSLRQHKVSVHKGVRFPCDQCDVSPFTQLSHLKRHKSSAHDGVTYGCNNCNHRATSKHLLNTHIKKVHNILQSM